MKTVTNYMFWLILFTNFARAGFTYELPTQKELDKIPYEEVSTAPLPIHPAIDYVVHSNKDEAQLLAALLKDNPELTYSLTRNSEYTEKLTGKKVDPSQVNIVPMEKAKKMAYELVTSKNDMNFDKLFSILMNCFEAHNFTAFDKALECYPELSINYTSDYRNPLIHKFLKYSLKLKYKDKPEIDKIDTIGHLLLHGADINAHINDNSRKISALDLAIRYGFSKKLIQFLLENGADSYAYNSKQKTIFHIAADKGRIESDGKVKNGWYKVLECLIELGYDVNIQDKNGKTPLDYARERGNHFAITALIKAGAYTRIRK